VIQEIEWRKDIPDNRRTVATQGHLHVIIGSLNSGVTAIQQMGTLCGNENGTKAKLEVK